MSCANNFPFLTRSLGKEADLIFCDCDIYLTVPGAYISSTTRLDGIIITGSDWSDCLLRKDQQKYLCKRAEGTNPVTGISTKESLLCPPE